MKRILELNDEDVGLEAKETEYTPRTAARAILRKGEKIALMHVGKEDSYKLPGGGVEEGESIQQGLRRELLEETGCEAEVKGEVGELLEHRSHIGIVQTSHCFVADVIKEGKPSFDEGEIAADFSLQWVTLEEAEKLLESSKTDEYETKFVVKRDLFLLRAAKELLQEPPLKFNPGTMQYEVDTEEMDEEQ